VDNEEDSAHITTSVAHPLYHIRVDKIWLDPYYLIYLCMQNKTIDIYMLNISINLSHVKIPFLVYFAKDVED